MHTFQPYPIDMLDINPFTKLSKEWALETCCIRYFDFCYWKLMFCENPSGDSRKGFFFRHWSIT